MIGQERADESKQNKYNFRYDLIFLSLQDLATFVIEDGHATAGGIAPLPKQKDI